ncbi:MAG: SBBP repeat-containing protein [Candidatus Cloacimonetes bacterium]|nr:SBBP repeat-containing protein [Candidatus Cloacimonadota bacterium]
MKKRTFILLGLLLIAVCAFAQAPEWQWAAKAGGIEWDNGWSITIDTSGNLYVTGWFRDSASFGSNILTSSGGDNIFVAKISSDGNWLWANSVSGSDDGWSCSITVDTSGSLYFTGGFEGTANFGSTTLTSNGSGDIFVAKVSSDGSWLWANNAGGNGWDRGRGISVDNFGDLYITGGFSGTASFDDIVLTSNGGYNDIFTAKMSSDGNWLWANNAGGNDWDLSKSITIDPSGNSYIIGYFYVTANFDDITLTSNGDRDIFIAMMSSDGNWVWADNAGGNDWDSGFSIAIDNSGNLYVTGFFASTASFGPTTLTSSGGDDIFVAKMDLGGNWLWARSAGGSSVWDWSRCITVDSSENLYITGDFEGTASFGETTLTSFGNGDIFVAKINSDGNWAWALNAGGISSDQSYGITVDTFENLYVTGYFAGTASFGSTMLTSEGSGDIFVAKLNSSVFAENEISPTVNSLSNYPNPFNPTTTINYQLPEDSKVKLSIYNIKGQKVKILVNKILPAGEHSIIWDGKDSNGNRVSSGIYFYKMCLHPESSGKAGDYREVRKMVLLK